MADEITLQCQFASSSSGVDINYVLTNLGQKPIFAFTPLPEYRNDRFEPDPKAVYIHMTGTGFLTFSKELWRTPQTVKVYRPEVPFLTRVAAGRSLEETIHLPAPLVVKYPYLNYGTPHAPPPRKSTSSGAVFVVGYLDDERLVQPSTVRASRELFTVEYGSGITHQQRVRSNVSSLSALVLS